MTEPLDLPDADPADLAASAALDAGSHAGEIGLGEAPAGADSPESLEPAVADRLEQFRRVQSAMTSGLTPPDPATRDAHIAAALAALTADLLTADIATAAADVASAEGPDATVAAAAPTDDLAARRTGAARHRTRNRWLAAAAAVALVALAVPLVNALRDQSSSTSNMAASTSGTEAPTAAFTPFGAPAEPRAGDNGVTTTSAAAATNQSETAASADTTFTPAVAGDLGSASSPQELAGLVQTAEPQAMTATPPPTGTADADTPTTTADPAGPAGCDGAVRAASPELGPLVVVTSAQYRGLPVEVLVYATTSGTGGAHRLIAVTPSDCAIVVDLTF